MARVDRPIDGFVPTENITVTRVVRAPRCVTISFAPARYERPQFEATVTDGAAGVSVRYDLADNGRPVMRLNRGYSLPLVQTLGKRWTFPLAALDPFMKGIAQ